ncbi:uncharacterized protein LOC131070389 [Cryptomeria japonica]|uniref:uncharacterized protein LOC131070389 n=1 Tax=Cryptomeria japonica TaxID=3369 RepID=UPI0027D9E126|nr:uncharacterized protein LOC131070389 [Cryptomeria japonica]
MPDSTVDAHASRHVAESPCSVDHTDENDSLHTLSTPPSLTDSGSKGEERNIPHPRMETSAGQTDKDTGEVNPKSSWKNALLGSTNSLPLDVVASSQTKDGMEIKLPDNLMDIIATSLHLTIVSRFFSFQHSIDMVKHWAKSHWKLKGSLEVSAMPGGLFLFKFITEEDLIYVLSGSWAYGKHFLTMAKWKPGFDPSTELNHMAPVWVRLPGLPLEFWDEQIFRWIGNSFGCFVAADSVTLNKSKLVYAHFCVNVTINKTLPNFISLKSKWGKWSQDIVYENATLYCQKCNTQGHSYTDCKSLVVAEPKIKNKAIWAEPINPGDPSSSTPLSRLLRMLFLKFTSTQTRALRS